MTEMGSTERYTFDVIVKPTRRQRHGFVVIEDNETGDNAATFDGPDALLNATAELAKLQERATRPETCVVKSRPGNMPCGEEIEHLTAEKARESGRGQWSGWYHVRAVTTHRYPVPKSWVS